MRQQGMYDLQHFAALCPYPMTHPSTTGTLHVGFSSFAEDCDSTGPNTDMTKLPELPG